MSSRIQVTSMLGFSQLSLFMGATLALLLVPGPAVLYITTRSLSKRRLISIGGKSP
jgi:threonine/homoserine/homoserine lactone efflux protein